MSAMATTLREAAAKFNRVLKTPPESRDWAVPAMILVDTHTHLDSPARRGELPALLRRAAEAQVGWMIAIGTDPDDWHLNRDLAREHPARIRYTVGIHPCSLPDDWEGASCRTEEWF
jgi:TatD DNase family protein